MALSTTQSIWRSGGGDNTRTAYCGSGIMAAQFYIAADDTAGPVVVSSVANAPQLVLPAGAIITAINVTLADSAGTVTLQAQPLNGGMAQTIVTALDVSATGTTSIDGTILTGAPVASLSNIVISGSALTTGDPVSGYIQYFVQDPLAGQQNV